MRRRRRRKSRKSFVRTARRLAFWLWPLALVAAALAACWGLGEFWRGLRFLGAILGTFGVIGAAYAATHPNGVSSRLRALVLSVLTLLLGAAMYALSQVSVF